jgi:hypothetical protein
LAKAPIIVSQTNTKTKNKTIIIIRVITLFSLFFFKFWFTKESVVVYNKEEKAEETEKQIQTLVIIFSPVFRQRLKNH